MNNSPINSTINSTTVVELADASSLKGYSKSYLVFDVKTPRLMIINAIVDPN